MIPIVLMSMLLSLMLLSGQGLAESPGAGLERAAWATFARQMVITSVVIALISINGLWWPRLP